MDYKVENGNLIIPDGVKCIVEKCIDDFRDRLDIESVVIPDGVELIDIWAFRDCKNLKSITIPASVKRIYRRAFEGCSSLETVNYNAVDCSYWGEIWDLLMGVFLNIHLKGANH